MEILRNRYAFSYEVSRNMCFCNANCTNNWWTDHSDITHGASIAYVVLAATLWHHPSQFIIFSLVLIP